MSLIQIFFGLLLLTLNIWWLRRINRNARKIERRTADCEFDAERYRWLRSMSPNADRMEAEIDAAIEKRKGRLAHARSGI
jgi:hypothetical protein